MKKTSFKTPKNSHIIGVKFNTKSEKYKTKEYYYITNKKVKQGDIIEVSVPNSENVKAIVSNPNYKGKKNNLKRY